MEYSSYLRLDELLSAQSLESARRGLPAHDEMLFIIVHQTYELWFKQVLHEIDAVQARMAAPVLDDREIGAICRALDRVLRIFDTLIGQIEILETMTPLDFLEFRDMLTPASGFQSVQFRLIETRLGLTRAARLSYDGHDYDDRLPEASRARVRAAEGERSLFDQVEDWLARTPFVAMGGYDFRESYEAALGRALDADAAIIASQPYLTAEQRAAQLANLERSRDLLKALFDPGRHAALQAEGQWRMRREALQAALFIMLYRDEPALQAPFQLLNQLMDLDTAMSLWRQRHALMVLRMIGRRVGTGGSSGHDYLSRAAERHRVFTDLFALVTFLLPGSQRPSLPDAVRESMAYRYAGGAA